MAIGDVRASGGLQSQLINDRSGAIQAGAMDGLGEAINRLAQAGMGYLNSQTEIEAIYDRRAQGSKALELDTQFLQYQKARAEEFTEFSRARSANPAGLTREYDATLGQREQEFLKTVPPRFQEEMKAKLAQDRATRVGSAFVSELSLLDTVDTNNLNNGLNTLGSSLKGGQITLEDAEDRWVEMLSKTSLPAIDQQEFLERGRATLQGLQFGTEVETAAMGLGAVGDGSSGDVVAAGLLPGERAVLNGLSSRESPGYDVWNGGSKFEGYEDHPAAFSKAPGKSTAAGKYQFILGTWRAASASYEKTYGVKVPNFSPEWQDRVALHHAEVVFNKWNREGLNFKQVLASGDPAQIVKIRRVLGNPKTSDPNSVEWEGWADRTFGPGGAAAADAAWLQVFMGDKGVAGGGTGAAESPNVWTDPRYSNITLEQKMSFANAASAAAEQQRQTAAAQIKFQRSSFLDEVYNAGYANQPGVLEALQQQPGWDAEAQAKYNSGQEVFRASENAVANVGRSLAEGSPLSPSEVKSFGKWFGEDSFAGIASGDQAAYQKMQWAVSQARIFPEGSSDAFMAALGNPNTAPAALSFLASAVAGDSSILKRSGFDAETIANVRLYKNLAEREANPESAFQKYSAATDATQRTGKTPTQLSTEATKLFQEAYPTAADLVNKWDGWFSSAPESKMNESLEGQLVLDASTAYQDGYRIYGTAEGAEAYMQTTLDNLWGVSQTNRSGSTMAPGGFTGERTTSRGVLMRHPPEKYYPSIDNDFGYLYKGIADFAEMAGASRNDAILIPDETTDQEVRSGKPPTYRVLGMGEYGEAILLPERFGGAQLEETAVQMIKDESASANSLGLVNNYSTEIVELEAQLALEQGYAGVLGPFGQVMTGSDNVLEMEAQLLDLKRRQSAAVLAAMEQGHIAPELAAENADVNAVAEDFAQKMAQQMATDNSLARRVKQAVSLSRGQTEGKVLARIISKELKVPAAMAEIIALKISEMQ